jgi:hypothetical protein
MYVRFCLYQFILFFSLFVISIPLDKYIGKPFTSVDLVAIFISLLVIIIVYRLVNKLYGRFENIRYRNKFLISIPVIILAALFIGLLEQLFFS